MEAILEFQSMVDRAATLHEEISAKDKELKELKKRLAEVAEYKEGSKTGRVYGVRYSATVSLKENVKWDQEALDKLRRGMGDEAFFKIFKWNYEPLSAKAVDGAMEFGAHGADLRAARLATPGAPQVTFKVMEAC